MSESPPLLDPNPNLFSTQTLKTPHLNVLLCGYVSKQAHSTSRWKYRFCVLTGHSLHWFKRSPDDSLFGVQLGAVEVAAIKRVNNVANNSGDGWFYWEVEAVEEGIMGDVDFVRSFRCDSMKRRSKWVSAIKMAMGGRARRNTFEDAASRNYEYQPTQVTPVIFPIILSRFEKPTWVSKEMPYGHGHANKNSEDHLQIVDCNVGSLPVSCGWDSKPIELWVGQTVHSWRLHLSNGQSITFAKQWLEQVEKGEEVCIELDKISTSFEQSLLASNLAQNNITGATVCVKNKVIVSSGNTTGRPFALVWSVTLFVSLVLHVAYVLVSSHGESPSSGVAQYMFVFSMLGSGAIGYSFAHLMVIFSVLLSCLILGRNTNAAPPNHSFEVTILKLEEEKASRDSDNEEEEEEKEEVSSHCSQGETKTCS